MTSESAALPSWLVVLNERVFGCSHEPVTFDDQEPAAYFFRLHAPALRDLSIVVAESPGKSRTSKCLSGIDDFIP
jgi:hypothetical protein